MKRLIKYILIILVFLPSILFAQSTERNKLEKERKKLEKEIKYIHGLLSENSGNKTATISELKTIEKKIYKRERLIKTIVKEIKLLDKQILQKKEIIHALQIDINSIKKEYAAMIVKAYQYQNDYNRLLFIFSAESFNDLYTRIKYMEKYTEYRKQQADLILKTQKDIKKRILALNEKRKEKRKLLEGQALNKKSLKYEVNKKNTLLTSLKKKESSLKKQLNKKKERNKKLKKAIKSIIEKALLAKRNINFKLSADFKKNKGKLPWPVEKGIIIGKYGRQQHPVYNIFTNNNGVDIKTTKGSKVRAIFNGKVSNIIFSPSFQNAVLINHGEYFTVYSNLSEVFVKKGQELKTKDFIGLVYTDDEKGKTEAHLEIWLRSNNETTTMNPEHCLFKQSF
ncbi:MAG TPA: hypothetical protein EYQ86_06960 [Bacteroidetes bacterium]|nr:hypothetical protein [Bacteroidota bacterium]